MRRGGFCYELNGLFAWLLKQIGFGVSYLEARDIHDDGSLGPEFDHLALLVTIAGGSTRWLADVGWGETFTVPLDVDARGEQAQGQFAYKLEPVGDRLQLWQRDPDGSWERQYSFTLEPHRFPAEYQATCLYHQTSPDSPFTQRIVASHPRWACFSRQALLHDYAQWSAGKTPDPKRSGASALAQGALWYRNMMSSTGH
jgi:N-hydroxyarylamine O-acetyltransferase